MSLEDWKFIESTTTEETRSSDNKPDWQELSFRLEAFDSRLRRTEDPIVYEGTYYSEYFEKGLSLLSIRTFIL